MTRPSLLKRRPLSTSAAQTTAPIEAAAGSVPSAAPLSRRAKRKIARRQPPLVARPRRRVLERLGIYEIREKTITTTTRQVEALNPALVSTLPQLTGPVAAVDLETGQPIYHNVHDLYAAGLISSPVTLVAGAVGTGKSSLCKDVYTLSPIALGDQVAIFDKKLQGSVGEYERAAKVTGGSIFRFNQGTRETIVNILDPRIVQRGTGGELPIVGQQQLLEMAARIARDGAPLHSRERHTLRHALQMANDHAAAGHRTPVLADVVEALRDPQPKSIPRGAGTRLSVDDMFVWGLDLSLELERFLGESHGDLSGLIDGETSDADKHDLDFDARLLLFDISALDEAGAAIPVVLATCATLLQSVWRRNPGRRRTIMVEEGYHTVRYESVASIFRSVAKRGRGEGTAVVTALHRLSDVPEGSEAISLLREAGVVHLFRQDKRPDAEAAVRLFGLPEMAVELLSDLDQGQHLLKIGSEAPRLVKHIRSSLATWVTDTDAAMRGEVIDNTLPEQFVPGLLVADGATP